MGLRQVYLFTYCCAQFLGWLACVAFLFWGLGETRYHNPQPAAKTALDIAWYTQCVAVLLELFHTVVGVTPTSLLPIFLQQGGRLLILWLARDKAEFATQESHWILVLLLSAYGITETIRYPYYALNVIAKYRFKGLEWLRYSAFYVLYPLGFAGEFGVIYQCLGPAKRAGDVYYYGVLLGNVVLLLIAQHLFRHMVKQRKKALSGAAQSKKTK